MNCRTSRSICKNLKTRERVRHDYRLVIWTPFWCHQPLACRTSKYSVRFFTCFKVHQFCYVQGSARATSQEVMFTSLDWKLTYFNSIYNHYENQDSRKVYTTTGPAAGGVWRLNPPPRVLLAYLPQDGQSLRSCKGILKDASNLHVMSKPTRTIYCSTTTSIFSHLIAKHKVQQ